MKPKRVNLVARLPLDVHRALKRIAKRKNWSLNAAMIAMCKSGLIMSDSQYRAEFVDDIFPAATGIARDQARSRNEQSL